jgi:hypothetical protein
MSDQDSGQRRVVVRVPEVVAAALEARAAAEGLSFAAWLATAVCRLADLPIEPRRARCPKYARRNRGYTARGMCGRCGQRAPEGGFKLCIHCRDYYASRRREERAARARERGAVVDAPERWDAPIPDYADLELGLEEATP